MRALAISALVLAGASIGCAAPGAAQANQVVDAIDMCATIVRARDASPDIAIADSIEEMTSAGWRTEGGGAPPRFLPAGSSVVWHAQSDAVAIGLSPEGGCWIVGRGGRGAVTEVAQSVQQNAWTRIPDPNNNQYSFVSAEPIEEGRHLLLFVGGVNSGELTAMVSTARWPQ